MPVRAGPGIVLTVLLWMLLGTAYSYYLGFSNYSRFYAGLSQIMIALIFFQVTAVAIILGAELNRGLIELKKLRNGDGSLLKKDGDQDGGAVAT